MIQKKSIEFFLFNQFVMHRNIYFRLNFPESIFFVVEKLRLTNVCLFSLSYKYRFAVLIWIRAFYIQYHKRKVSLTNKIIKLKQILSAEILVS